MITLNKEQDVAVNCQGHCVVTACPGSGKTRVLTARVIRGLSEIETSKERVIALTYTNRAADEIRTRLDYEGVESGRLWAGTIHSFALEWILRPYAPYCEILKQGFTVADEYVAANIINSLKKDAGLNYYESIETGYRRDGSSLNSNDSHSDVLNKYKDELRKLKLIDYDDILYLAYKILEENKEIGETLGDIFRVVCVDEVQDIQDLQYGILSEIYKTNHSLLELFFVGDSDQSIYESLGALTKTPKEIAVEFGIDKIEHLNLVGNYRSSQRLIDFYRKFRTNVSYIKSLGKYASHQGLITFENQTTSVEDVAPTIAKYIEASLSSGVPPEEICIVAPWWTHVRSLARNLVGLLPDVDFDAPGLSPLYCARDNFWFNVTRLILSTPSASRSRTRIRWANEAVDELAILTEEHCIDRYKQGRRILRIINSIDIDEQNGFKYLQKAFDIISNEIGVDIESDTPIKRELDIFLEKIEEKIDSEDYPIENDIDAFRKLFNNPSGVVVSTCHGVKGEEYETVIAFGLLQGYVPHWNVIFDNNLTDQDKLDRESKLLYVVFSRAKKNLHLISEKGRKTKSNTPYRTSGLLQTTPFEYNE